MEEIGEKLLKVHVTIKRSRSIERDEQIDVTPRASVIARHRTEDGERLHTERIELGAMLAEQADRRFAFHTCIVPPMVRVV